MGLIDDYLERSHGGTDSTLFDYLLGWEQGFIQKRQNLEIT